MTAQKNTHAAFSLNEPELLELLRIVDASGNDRAARDRRKHVRHALVCRDVSIKVVQPGGGATERRVTVRDLSAGGTSILYPGYLHSGTSVQVELRKRAGGNELIQGQVANCRHVHGVWHALGVKFKEVIFPQVFLTQAPRSDLEESSAVKIDASRLKGSVLLLDDQAMDRNLFTHILKGSSLRVTETSTPEEAVALVTRAMAAEHDKSGQSTGQYDLIVCDLNLGAVAGTVVISQIREKGYRGPLLLMTAETMPDRIAAAMAAGGTGVLQKPYGADKLHAAIASQLGDKCLIIDDPIFSPLAASPANQPMVEKYVTEVRTLAAEMQKWVKEENLAQVRVICQSLKGTGAGYGFTPLTEVASATLVSLDASYSVAESITELHRLDAICSRLTSAEPPAQPKPRR
jgi:CheY-like chemotaxis protein